MDILHDGAQFYDHQSFPIDDVDFYINRLPSPQASVLELGCGTGRVLVPLSAHCGFIHGVDISKAMLEICRHKLRDAGIPVEKAQISRADISDLHLGRRFDLITAPFRVFQTLTEDAQIAGFFETVRRHLAPGGSAIVNTFRPNSPPAELVERNSRPEHHYDDDLPYLAGRLLRYHFFRKPAEWDGERLVFYPNLVYKYVIGDELQEEAVMAIAMRVWYPNQLLDLIESRGFEIAARWGGYQGEAYGQGPEQVVQFTLPAE